MWYQVEAKAYWDLIILCMQPFTIMCKQTETMHVGKQLKPEQLKEPMVMYDCDQHLSNSQL